MRKHIICHYKNGALLFCTHEYFPLGVSQIISDIFKQQGLSTILEPKSKGQYRIVGRMNLNYDPFEKDHIEWGEVISKMNITKEVLENKLVPVLGDQLPLNASKYFRL